MGFYEELSKYYDIVFPLSKNKLEFIEGKLESKSKVLDIACGTGNYSIELAKSGHYVDGIDLDEEMINIAIRKSVAENVKAKFQVGDMRKINEIFAGKYDMIYCIGNSLVHLRNIEEIKIFIKKTYEMLEDDGRLIIQIVNYDRIFKYNVDHLPTIKRKEAGVEFVRKYRLNEFDDKIYFNTEIIVTKNNEEKTYSNSIPLIPLESTELYNILKISGFSNIDFYGDFNGGEFNVDSYPLVAVASKYSN